MRVLIVGCGYVGSALAGALVQQGHTVHGLRRQPAAAGQLEALGVRPVFADITQLPELRAIRGPFDWVVNCVASPFGAEGEDYRRTYWEGTRTLLAWLRDMPLERFIYTSSTGVYGQDDGSWVDESSVTEPEAPTAQVLVATEQELLRAFREQGLPATILRLAGIYGPGRAYWLRQFLQGQARIPGDGTRWMNMVHRDDIVAAIQAVLEQGASGRVFNVCDNEPVRHLEFFGWLAGRLGRSVPPLAGEDALPRRKRGLTHKRVANARLLQTFDYTLKYPSYREGYDSLLRAMPTDGTSTV